MFSIGNLFSTKITSFEKIYDSINSSINQNKNIALEVPENIMNDLMSYFYEENIINGTISYFIELAEADENKFKDTFINIYNTAMQNDNHIVLCNLFIMLSQIDFSKVCDWAPSFAISALYGEYIDVDEIIIKLFEAWEDKEACELLKLQKFEYKWLQDFADEVIDYSVEVKENELYQKNKSWKMDKRGFSDRIGEGSKRGYYNERTENEWEQIISMASVY